MKDSQLQHIDFVEHQEVTEWFNHKNIFKYQKPKGGGIEQEIIKACFWVLRKFKQFYNEPVRDLKVVRHTIDKDRFMEEIFKQRTIVDLVWNIRPKVILVGSEDYARIMNCSVVNQMFSFRPVYARWENGRQYLCDLEVIIIPWMSGILVMPR